MNVGKQRFTLLIVSSFSVSLYMFCFHYVFDLTSGTIMLTVLIIRSKLNAIHLKYTAAFASQVMLLLNTVNL